MKKILFILLLLPMISFSQVEIVPFAGYMFGGSANFVEGRVDVTDGLNYGVSILVPVRHDVDFELNYTRMDCEYTFRATDPRYTDDYTIGSVNYIHVGALKIFELHNPDIMPFGSFSLGTTIFSSPDYADTWRFSIALGAGLKYWLTDRIGIIIRGRLLLPMNLWGVSGFVGFGTGGTTSGMSASFTSAIVQGDFNGGLVFSLGK